MAKLYTTLCFALLLLGCKTENNSDKRLKVVTTTTMITDLVENIGGDLVNVRGLMGSGVDPHLYKASEGDVNKLGSADVVFYNGLHLEGKLVEVFEKMQSRNVNTVALSDALDQSTLIGSEYFASNYDPHIWFSVEYWEDAANYVVNVLSEEVPEYKEDFEKNGKIYIEKLRALQDDLNNTISYLPPEKRILVTAHDAFNYFGRSFGFEVVGLQGISTATEAGVQDVQRLATFIIDKKIKAIFVESSVPQRTIEALKAAVNAQGTDVEIGGTLYSDALGNAGTEEGTYIGMFKYNVETIVNALK